MAVGVGTWRGVCVVELLGVSGDIYQSLFISAGRPFYRSKTVSVKEDN